MRPLTFGILLSLALAGCCKPEEILSDYRDKRHWFRTIILARDQLTIEEMETVSRRFLQEAMPGRTLVVLSAFTSAQEAARATSINRGSYRQWRVYYEDAVKRPSPAAELIAINGNAAIVLRKMDGTVTRLTLRGKDPLHFRVSGADFEILLIHPRRTTRFDQCPPTDTLSPRLYLRTKAALTTSLCERASKYIAGLVRAGAFNAQFRNDHWFISSAGYPVLDLFSVNESPPSEQEYNRSPTFNCGKSCRDQMLCAQTMGSQANHTPK